MLKLTQPHLPVNNMFPPINSNSRPTSEDLRPVVTNGTNDIHTTSKQNQIRRQQTIEQQRRSPLRSNSLIPSTSGRYVSAAAATAVATAQTPSVSVSPLVRSPSFVQPGTTVITGQFEPAKIIYRTNDYAWNDQPNPSIRAVSPMKNKSSSARNLTNGTIHDSTAVTTGNSMLQVPTPSSSQQQYHHNTRDDMNNVDLHVSSTGKSRHMSRLQRTNSHLEKTPGTATFGIPIRSESYRSSRIDYGLRPRHTSSKQRHYVNSKTSFHDLNSGDYYLASTQDENIYYHQQQQQMNLISSTQRLNGSAFDLTASRKPLSPNRSSTFNAPSNPNGQHPYYNSTQELHRSETNIDRNQFARYAMRNTASKEQNVSTPKHRQTSNPQTTTPLVTSNTPAERHPSAQSYKSRDPNISYAYNDVKKYIEENDLMSPEKEHVIRNWVLDVEKYRHQFQKLE